MAMKIFFFQKHLQTVLLSWMTFTCPQNEKKQPQNTRFDIDYTQFYYN